MSLLVLQTPADYIDFVERAYFGAVKAGDAEAVLAHFAPGAALTAYMGDAPARVMRRAPGASEESLDDFMRAGERFDLTYLDFVHFVDCAAERVASHFTLLIVPRAGDVPSRRMRNCNFFQFRDGVLVDVIAYFCNPGKART
jgi:ketosteroid isomerase-like protein